MTGWLESADVAAWAGIDEIDGNDALDGATAGAVAFVERQRPDLDTGQGVGFTPTADVKLGTTMLASRLYERRGAMLGVVGFTGYDGTAQAILRYDPDIEQLLQIGRSRPFGFGSAS